MSMLDETPTTGLVDAESSGSGELPEVLGVDEPSTHPWPPRFVADLVQSLAEVRAELADIKTMVQALTQAGGNAVTVEQAGAMLGCKRTQVFALLKAGKLTPAPKVGRARMVTTASVQALLEPALVKPRGRPQAPRVVKPPGDWTLKI